VSGATSYKIQISKYSNFSTTLRSAEVTGSSFRPASSLPTGVTLYWRVQAYGPNGPSLWAAAPVWTFKIVVR
jgi:hypothetical protein